MLLSIFPLLDDENNSPHQGAQVTGQGLTLWKGHGAFVSCLRLASASPGLLGTHLPKAGSCSCSQVFVDVLLHIEDSPLLWF